jgi:hypothetical protein
VKKAAARGDAPLPFRRAGPGQPCSIKRARARRIGKTVLDQASAAARNGTVTLLP